MEQKNQNLEKYGCFDCYFKAHNWENYDFKKYGISPVCNGPQTGWTYSTPLCKAHYEFCVKNNELGVFISGLKPLVEETIDNCYFRKYNKENYHWNEAIDFGTSGPCKGPQVGWMAYNAICKAHWDFVTEANKISHFCELKTMDKKPAKKEATKKVVPSYTVRTQKAKGLQALKDTHFPVPAFQIFDVKTANPDALIGNFVRPCPMRPRHGFVDSRSVPNREEADKIIKETLTADPEAEFLLMSYVPAPFSGIWTPGYLAVGQGTDGATAGKTAITIPIMGDFLARGGYGDIAKKNAGIESAPYVEILWRKEHNDEYETKKYMGLTVQLRDGPKLPEGAEDFIPNNFVVENVIMAEGDLLEWEGKMREVPANSVVWHPNGTMASHYAIHAVLNKVPLLITREPKIGEALKPTTNQPGEVNIDLMRAGFQIACDLKISKEEAAYFMLVGCHQTTQWLGKFDILLGASMGFSYRLAMTAALGEERHYKASKNKIGRDKVYTKYWEKADSQYGRTKFLDALEKFLNGHAWPSSNYGGKAWFGFTSHAVLMYNALIRKDHKSAMEAMNKLVNAAHNSGWGFNKFISQNEMTHTAKNPIYSGFHVGPYLYEVLTASNELVKSAARSFWKRKELELPTDKGTGMGKFSDDKSHDEDDPDECSCPDCTGENEEEHEEEHFYSSDCECDKCKKKKFGLEYTKKQVVTQAHVKVINHKNNTVAHIQYKSENCPKKMYWTKDIMPCPEPIQEMYEELSVNYDTSYADTETKYLILFKQSVDFHFGDNQEGKAGWGIWKTGENPQWVKLLDLEVTPKNAS